MHGYLAPHARQHHLANGWIFEPFNIGPDIVDYNLKEGPHAPRHAIQRTYYQRVADGIETTARYEESGEIVHFTWFLAGQTLLRFSAIPAWLAADMSVSKGDNQDPKYVEKIKKLASQNQDMLRKIMNDVGYFEVLR